MVLILMSSGRFGMACSLKPLTQECGPNDYEKWSPPTPELCLMGRNITLERRKPDAACFNGKRYERPEGVNETCPCYRVSNPVLVVFDSKCCCTLVVPVSGDCPPNGLARQSRGWVDEDSMAVQMDFECEFGYELDLSGGCSPMVGIDVNSCPSVAQACFCCAHAVS